MFWNRFRRAPLRRSLFFLLLPVLASITLAELWMTDRDALDAANAAYDRSLYGAVKSIAGNISTSSGGLSVELPYRLFEYFELTANGAVHFRVATSDGLVELGSADLPAPPGKLVEGVPVFYDARYFGESVRLAAFTVALERPVPPSQARTVLIQVAESTQSRQDFTRRFVQRSAYRDAGIFGLTLLTVVAAVTLALAPLAKLALQVRGRSADDLTPIDGASLSADVQPLVAAVNQQIRRTQELAGRQRQFVDDASHQLRTHLTTLQLQTDHALGAPDPAQLRHTLDALKLEMARATHTTNQLLALARSDTVDLHWQHFELSSLVRDVVLNRLPQARKKDIDLGASMASPAVEARGDPDFLREALLNLVSNAVAYTPPGGEITVLHTADAHGWSLGVTDNGPGLNPLERAQLGQRFVRTSTGGPSGSGLGLAITRAIAEKHGGSLQLESRQDGSPGLHARICWPRQTATVAA
jgi:two-component system sensor histidine kinase TctE